MHWTDRDALPSARRASCICAHPSCGLYRRPSGSLARQSRCASGTPGRAVTGWRRRGYALFSPACTKQPSPSPRGSMLRPMPSCPASTTAFHLAGGLHHAFPDRARASASTTTPRPPSPYPQEVPARVLYIDTDVHHGDGVQWFFYTIPMSSRIDPRDGQVLLPRHRLCA